MEHNYDVVVIGAGNGGLSAAASSAKMGLKTLLIEQHNLPGGFATSFVRGRFEFEPSLHEFCNIGTADDQGPARQLIDSYGVAVEWVPIEDAYRVITTGEGADNLDIIMPFGEDAYVDRMEEYVPSSRPSMEKFMALCKDIMDALAFIRKSSGKVDTKVMMKEHSNFLKCGGYSVNRVLKSLHMPEKAQRILCAYWCYLGVDCDKTNFALYATMLYKYLQTGAWIPKQRSHELSAGMDKRIREMGGDIWYNTRAKRILMKDGKITGVDTSHGTINCSHIIAGCSPNAIFGEMMDEKDVPEKQKRMVNARNFGGRGFVLYLGLNRSAEELGLKDYSYFIYGSMNTAKEVARAKDFNDHPMQATVCLNVANPDCSPKGTCIMSFTTLYTQDVWGDISTDEYVTKKREVAENMIRDFEEHVGVTLTQYIEEIEIATPVTMARYTLNPQGTMYSYESSDWDTLLARLMMLKDDQIVPGIRFAGGYGPRIYGYSSTYMNGDLTARLTATDIREEKAL
ncbi:MAG: NAD(P)/FAD-dependent oxidoreductase [Clostridiales bacterium]|nr:NAD(P)/FAD-dependent oxidoreductase [Clostridiales bacterium]